MANALPGPAANTLQNTPLFSKKHAYAAASTAR
jgi:hypothetical protein